MRTLLDKSVGGVLRIYRGGEFVRADEQEMYLALGKLKPEWISAASRQGGKSLAIAFVLFETAVLDKRDTVIAKEWLLDLFGIGVRAYRDGLHALETVGLVSVERHTGRKPRVTLLNYKGRRADWRKLDRVVVA